ncbi:MAG: lamin tail domain-containing protein [Pirellulales bacterium]|nr:lamin tail domain-containing protein [Pirellulales bacterium]
MCRRGSSRRVESARQGRLVLERLEPRRVLNSGPLIISELMADNHDVLADGDGDYSDWIEIHNRSDATVSLDGWYLTDDAANLAKWRFPAVALAAGDYRVVFASQKDLDSPPGELHTSFKLDADGEYLALVEPDGLTVAHEYAPQFPQQLEDVSYGPADVTTVWETLVDSAAPVKYRVPTATDDLLGWAAAGYDDSAWVDAVEVAAAELVIAEINAGEVDWVEIQNVSDQALDTDGWFVAVNDTSSGDIRDIHEVVWNLPTSVAAGEVLYRTDDSGEHYWGSEIDWSTGNGWAAIVDDSGEIVDFLVWGYSEAEIESLALSVGGFDGIAVGDQWRAEAAQGGATEAEVVSIEQVWSYEQSNTDLDTAWRTVGYDDSQWASGAALLYVESSGLPAPKNTPLTLGATTYYFRSHFQLDAHPASVTQLDLRTVIDDGAIIYLNGVEVYRLGMPEGAVGHSTFAGRGVGDASFEGPFTIPTEHLVPGDNVLAVEVHQTSAGSSDVVMGLEMTATIREPALQRVGDFDANQAADFVVPAAATRGTQNPGLARPFVSGSFPALTGVGFSDDADFDAALRTDVGAAMLDVNASLWSRIEFEVADLTQFDVLTLRMKYDDGFVAYLNGTQVAQRLAPDPLRYDSAALAARADSAAVVFEEIDISDYLGSLRTGTNVLAIHGLNVTPSDGDLLILPELVATSILDGPQYMTTPTPGSANMAGALGWVTDTRFSVDRGFYDAPFDLEITTDTIAAEIRYTLDGSQPTATTGTVFAGPITIDRTTTLRAAAFKTGYIPTDVDTHTYLFLDDVLTQSPDGLPPEGWPAGPVNNQVLVYGMDPDIVNHPVWGPQMNDSLASLPTLSLVTDLDNLFDPTTGIFVHAGNDGADWERPTSVELIYPEGADGAGFPDGAGEGFHIDAGLRIRGGYSRSGSNPKHAFRLFFRDEYGDAKLDYPLFGAEGADAFDKIDLRTSQNYSWAFGGPDNNTMVREVFSRDAQGAMGQPYTRSRYYHLYINGQYWGVFQTQERAEARYAASNMGGDPEDYDVLKPNDSMEMFATDGNMDAYTRLWQETIDGFANDVDYYRVQGLNPDGTPNPAYERLLDVDNLIDYMIITYYTGDRDGPGSRFTTPRPNNFYAIYNRADPDGWKFFEHDSEHSLGTGDDNMVTPLLSEHPDRSQLRYFNAHWLHEQLCANQTYVQRFADRVYQRFFNDGVLQYENALAAVDGRAAQIDSAMIAESARWGDTRTNPPCDHNTWANDVNEVRNWIVNRTSTVIGQLRAVGWYPNVDAPALNQPGGQVPAGFELLLSAPAGTIWYTLDGTDPQMADGGVAPGAEVFVSSTTTTTLVPQGAVWAYLDDGSDQSTAWYATGFDDSGWDSGPAQLGYGDGDEATVIGYGTENNKFITTYFRRAFQASEITEIDELTVEVLRDDGAVVYLNGQEIARSNMPGGEINYLTPSGDATGSESTFYAYAVDPALLVEGENVLAVEVHQRSGTSSDVSFDLRLRATSTTSPTPLLLGDSLVVKARVQDGGQWSALCQAEFLVGAQASAENLIVSEIHYNPPNPTPEEEAAGFTDNDAFEFIELYNTGDEPIDLTGVRFTRGIAFDFAGAAVTQLGPHQYLLVVANEAAFSARYETAGLPLAGQYTLGLDNGGEQITLADWTGQPIVDFAYDDGGDWPGRPDGNGASLELIDPAAVPCDTPGRTDYLEDGDHWRATSEYGGTPGSSGNGVMGEVVVNEVLSHTDEPWTDVIELYNTTGEPIDLSGWYLSDSNNDYLKFRIPDGTTIVSGGYVVFDEDDFNPTPLDPAPSHFALDGAHGDDVWLMAADAAGRLTRFVDHVEFGAAANGESFGRWPNGSGGLYPMTAITLDPADGENSGPRVGPVVISEVQYNPGNSPGAADFEFIEIYNSAATAVDLTNWRIRKGVDYDFPAETELAAHGVIVIVPFDLTDADKLAAFRTFYGLDASVPLLGGYSGQLDDGGERVQLQRPDEPPLGEPDYFPRLLEDEVDYDDEGAWPAEADGTGNSLNRTQTDVWGSDGAGWVPALPTPGTVGLAASAEVAGRYVFYNHSAFDGNDAAANARDDDAIAPDKVALRPGETATLANYTNYTRGINGIMVDLAGLPEPLALGADSFQFHVGNNNDPSSWDAAPAPSSISVRPGGGVAGSARVTIVWPDYAIQKQWLQVTVLAGAETALSTDDVFYFGNAVGEAGNSTSDAKVNATDMLLARNNPRNFLNPAPLDFHCDFNRDARVNATDMLIARNNQTNFLNALRLITVPFGETAPSGKVAAEKATDEKEGGGSAAETEPWTPQATIPAQYVLELAAGEMSRSAKAESIDDVIDMLLADGAQ